jgi:hypothetical protein
MTTTSNLRYTQKRQKLQLHRSQTIDAPSHLNTRHVDSRTINRTLELYLKPRPKSLAIKSGSSLNQPTDFPLKIPQLKLDHFFTFVHWSSFDFSKPSKTTIILSSIVDTYNFPRMQSFS